MSNPETALGAGAVSWWYVPTDDNPADDITRRLHSVELNVNHHYSAGPEFVYKAAEFSPENKVEVALEDDKRKRKQLKWVGVSQESEPVLRWKRYIPSEAKESAGLMWNTICKEYTSKEGTGARQTGPLVSLKIFWHIYYINKSRY